MPKKLEGTKFSFKEHNDYVEAICPWGNRVRCFEPNADRFGRITLGIPYVEFDVPTGSARGICEFYPKIMGMPAQFMNGEANVASVQVGKNQHLVFRETDRPQAEYDGHHVQIYITNFSGPHRALAERNLIFSEDNPYQYRFRDIVDLASGKHLFTIEHEVRSATHPMFLRPLVNRNPSPDQPHLCRGLRPVAVGDGAGPVRRLGLQGFRTLAATYSTHASWSLFGDFGSWSLAFGNYVMPF